MLRDKRFHIVCMVSIMVFVLVCAYVCVSSTLCVNPKRTVEHFKKKKKGKKALADGVELDLDEIIGKVQEATEDKEEPENDEDLDPEDDDDEDGDEAQSEPGEDEGGKQEEADYAAAGAPGGADADGAADDGGGASGGGGPDPNAFVPPSRVDRAPSKPSVVRTTMEDERKTIAAQPDYIVSDVLNFKRVVPFSSKRLICVVPNQLKHLYIVQINNDEGNAALLIGPSSEQILIDEAKPIDIQTIKVYDPQQSFDAASADCKYFIFYDYASPNHPFWKWLNKKDVEVSFIDYFRLIETVEQRQAVLTQYPYFHINTVDVKYLLPGKSIKRRHIHTMMADTCVYSNKPFKTEFYQVYNHFHGNREYQMFYELFFPYYLEIIRHKIGVDPSTKLKEAFVNSMQTRALLDVDTPLPSLESTSYIRDAFKELTVSKSELRGVLKARLSRGDRVRFTNQAHRTLEGEFYVIEMRLNRVLLQSRWLIKNMSGFKMMGKDKAVASGIDKRIGDVLLPRDLVFLKEIDRPATFLSYDRSKKIFFFSINDDIEGADGIYRCVTQPNILQKPACVSAYDEFGAKKPHGVDVWDRPCMYDEECPFFGKGKWSRFRGGCTDGGYCEMPIGFQNVGYRYYAENKQQQALIAESDSIQDIRDIRDIRFPGDVFEA